MNTTIESQRIDSLTADIVANLSKTRGEPQWVTELRVRAWNQFQSLPWPHKKDERWKRTQLNLMHWDQLLLKSAPPARPLPLNELSASLTSLASPTVDGMDDNGVFFWDVDAGFHRRLPDALAKRGVEWLPLGEAIEKKSAPLQKAWEESINQARSDKFILLTLALS